MEDSFWHNLVGEMESSNSIDEVNLGQNGILSRNTARNVSVET